MSASSELPAAVRAVVLEAWRSRYQIEVESLARFAALARRMAAAGAPPELVERAETASADERRHAAECVTYVALYGSASDLPPAPDRVREFAPRSLDERQRLTYEMVTTCCISETQSAANLVTLFNASPPEPLRTSLQALSRDEVTHSQLGWAYLEWARGQQSLQFLVPLVSRMIEGDDRRSLMGDAPPQYEDPRLLEHGVLPHSARRELFIATLEQVIFPGFERVGVTTGDARAWLTKARV